MFRCYIRAHTPFAPSLPYTQAPIRLLLTQSLKSQRTYISIRLGYQPGITSYRVHLLKNPSGWPYRLQIAAVDNMQAITTLKEKLALLGFDVFITEIPHVHLPYRINVGPYATLHDAQAEQIRLKENNISSIVMRNSSKAKHVINTLSIKTATH